MRRYLLVLGLGVLFPVLAVGAFALLQAERGTEHPAENPGNALSALPPGRGLQRLKPPDRAQYIERMARQRGADGKLIIGFFLRCLAQGDAASRKAAVVALGNLGPDAGRALPAVQQALHDPDGEVRAAAAEALKKIVQPSAARPARSPDPPTPPKAAPG